MDKVYEVIFGIKCHYWRCTFSYSELINSSESPLQIYQNVIFRYWVGKLVTTGVCGYWKVSLFAGAYQLLASGIKQRS